MKRSSAPHLVAAPAFRLRARTRKPLSFSLSRLPSAGAICAVLSLATGGVAEAGTINGDYVWDGGAAPNPNWSEPANWDVGVPVGNDRLFFGGTTNLLTNNDLVGYNGYRIFFIPGAGNFTLGGNAITLFDFGGAAPKIENNASGTTQTISLALTLDGAGTGGTAEVNPVDGNLLFTSGVTLASGTQLDIFGNNGNTVTFNGILGGDASNKFVLKQNSTVIFNAANTYGGSTELDAGSLQIGATGGLNAGSMIFVGNGLQTGNPVSLLLTGAAGGQTLANLISINPGNGTNRTIGGTNTGGTNTFTGAIDMSGTSGENRSVSFTANAGGTVNFTGVISGSAGVGQDVNKLGAGTVVLSNAANTYSGQTRITAGTLSVGASGNLGDASATNGLALSNGGTLRTTATLDLGANRGIAIGTGGGILSAQTGTTLTASGVLSGADPLTAAGGGIVALTANNSGFTGGANVISVSGNTTNTTLRLSGANALTSGTITVEPGLAAAGGNGNQVELAGGTLPAGVALTLNTIGASNSRATLFGGSGVNGAAGPIAFRGDGSAGLNVGAGAILTVDGNISAGAGGYTGTFFMRGSGSGVVNGAINLPAASLAKTDSGMWTVNTPGTWLNTQVSLGTLRLGAVNVLPIGTALLMGQNDASAGTLDLGGFNQTIGSLTSNPTTGTNANSKTITSAAPATLRINQDINTTYGSVFSGPVSLEKAGLGTLILAPAVASLRSGTTLVTGGGRLTLNLVGAAGTGDITVNSGSSLLSAHDAATQNFPANVFLDNGSFLHSPASNQQLGFTTGKAITIASGGGTITVAPGAGAASKVLLGTGQLAGSGLLTKTGPGVIQISGANTGFSGNVAIEAGTIEFQNADSLGTTPINIAVASGGDLATSGTNNRNNVTLNNGGILSANSTAANYTGTVNVAGNGTAALRQFQTVTTPNSFTISGPLTGGGTLNVTAPTPGATLTLSGEASTFTGTISPGSFATVAVNNPLGMGSSLALNGGTVSTRFASTSGAMPGLQAIYYNFGSDPDVDTGANSLRSEFGSDLLALQPRAFSRIDPNINIPNGGSGTYPTIPVPGYEYNINDAALWKGQLNITTAGSYQFNALNDDGSVLFIDGVQIGTAGVSATGVNMGTPVTLSAGAHNIVYKFGQGTGGGYTVLRYSGPDSGNALVTVPASAFTQGAGPAQIGAVSGTGMLDIVQNTEASSLSLSSGSTFTTTSAGIDNLTITGATTLNGGTATFVNNTAGLIFNGPIGELSATSVSFTGNYLRRINGTSSYTGLTSVTGGQLDLNAAAGNAIPAGLSLNVSSTATTAQIRTVNFQQSDQIADAANVALQGVSILHLGGFSDTIGSLTMTSGQITGTGSLTIADFATSTFASGLIEAGLAGTGPLTKTSTGTLSLAGSSTYTGITDIQAGTLLARSGSALGATGSGNGTIIGLAGELGLLGTYTMGENLTSNSATGVRTLGGDITSTGSISYGAAVANATLQLGGGSSLFLTGPASINGAAGNTSLTVTGAGELSVSTPIALGSGVLTKAGSGSLIFAYNTNGSLPPVTFTSGALGFSGPQTGTYTVPVAADRAFKFNTDPGAGATIVAAAGSTVLTGFDPDQAFLSRFTSSSAGDLVLTEDLANNLNFSAGPNLALGARGRVTYSGVITPNAGGYRLGGSFIGSDSLQNILTITQSLTGANSLTLRPGSTVDLTRVVNTFTGPTNIAGGAALFTNPEAFGSLPASNTLTLSNGGVLRLAQTSGNAGSIFSNFGVHPLTGAARTIAIGTGGGTIDVVAAGGGGNGLVLSNADALQSAAGNTLTKSGLGFLFITNANPNFSGSLVIGAQGNQVDLRGLGALPNVAAITIQQSGTLNLDNNASLGSNRGFLSSALVADRISNTAPITLNGGTILFVSRTGVLSTSETLGAISLGAGQSAINANSNAGGNSSSLLSFGSLNRITGSTLRFGGTAGTLGVVTANNTQVTFSGLATAAVLPYATLFGSNLAAYNATTGVIAPTYATGTTAAQFIAGNLVDLTADVTLTADSEVNGFRMTGAATRNLLFPTATTRLAVTSGAIASDASNNLRNIGSAAVRGRLTAGPLASNAAPRELFLHNNTNTMTVFSTIENNNGQAVSVVKDLDGVVALDAPNSTYTGGTFLNRGRVNVSAAGGLGFGGVNVKNSVLQLNVAGAVTSGTGNPAATAPVYTVTDQSELFLNSTTTAFNTPTDRFDIAPGSLISGSSSVPGFGLNALTYLAPGTNFSGGGQIRLAPGAIVRSTGVVQNADLGTLNMIKGLPNDAALYLNMGSTTGDGTTLSIGTGTPWRGLASGRTGATFSTGTIFANSDFELQGTTADNAVASVVLGGTGQGSFSIVNTSGQPINALVSGTVVLNEASPLSMANDLTFVVSNGSTLQPNLPNQFGSGGNVAKLIVQAGATLDPGNYAAVGTAANQPQGFVYPVDGPVNASQTLIEPGGRLLVNDPSGLGTSPVGSIQLQTGSVLELGAAQSFLGANAGFINPGQLVFSPGTIVRLAADNVFRLDQFVTSLVGRPRLVFELTNQRSITDATNPTIVATPGVSQIEAMDVVLGNGDLLTNDSTDRQINERRGRLVLEDGAVLAASTQSFLNIQESVQIAENATITIGSNLTIDGVTKLGSVQFNGPQSNVIPASATLLMLNGTQLAFGAANTWPDARSLDLPLAVTSFPSAGGSGVAPGNGTSLLLNVANFIEVMGPLTGNGAVIANQAGAFIAPGFGATTDFTFNGVFKNTNGQQANLYKVGTTKMMLSGTSDSTGDFVAAQGELAITGIADPGQVRALRGATFTIDNTAAAVSNRLGTPAFYVPSGGTFNLIGHNSVPVVETTANLANSTGALANATQNPAITFLKVTPGTATTTFVANAAENFQNQGIGLQKSGTWVFHTPTLANLPGSYTTAGVFTPNGLNLTNGLIQIVAPNFAQQGGFGVGPGGNITAAAGTPVVATRPDFLGDPNATGTPLGFVTEDLSTAGLRLLAASEYASFVRDNVSSALNTRITGTLNTSGDTRVQTLTLTPGSTVNINGTLPLNGTPSRLHLNAAGVFVEPGGVATINGSDDTFLQANGGASLFLHTIGDLNLNATAFSDNAIVKTGAGTLNVGPGAFAAFRGSLQIDGGTVNLGSGNSFANIRGGGGFTTNANLFLNNGTLNLNGNSQFVNTLNSAGALPGLGGILTSASAATVTVNGGGIFAGQITGEVSLDKTTSNTLLLTNDNTFAGTTLVRSGTLSLRDSGTLSGTQGVELQNATLQIDNSGLANIASRVAPSAPVTLKGGTINLTGAAAQTATQRFDTVNLAAGRNDFTSNAGGSGVNVLEIGNLVRPVGGGAFLNFNQNYGFLGAAGNSSTAIRNLITNVNGAPLALNDNLLGGWAVVGGSNFATYLPTRGIGALGNTGDGFAAYDSGDFTTALATHNVSDGGAARTLTASRTINSLRSVMGATATYTFNTGAGLTLDTGGFLTDGNFALTLAPAANATGSFLTSTSGELDVWVNQNTTNINVPITGSLNVVKSGPATLSLAPTSIFAGTVALSNTTIATTNTAGLAVGMPVSNGAASVFPAGTVITAINPGTSITVSAAPTVAGVDFRVGLGNSYSGTTFVNNGTLLLSMPAVANGFRTVPGDLVINNALVTEVNVTGQLNPNANLTITGTGRYNLVNAAGVTTTLGSLTVLDLSGATGTANILDRTATQPTSIVNLTASTAITTNNTNPATSPFVGGFTGIIGFTNSGGSTLQINSPVTVNGLGAVGLRIGAQIGAVPTGIADGGLIKRGTGLLTLDNGAANFTGVTSGYNGSLTSLVDVLNVAEGSVRFDSNGSLGTNTANTTVQSGAVLMGSNNASIVATGSVKLKAGSTLAGNTNAFTLGLATATVGSQSVLNVPSGTATIALFDFFVPSTNGLSITANGRLTGAGTIDLLGAQITNASGVFQLGNPILTGSGANDFTGTLNVNPNTVLASQQAVVGAATSITGNELAGAKVNLNGGRLRLRDDFSTNNSNQTGQSATYLTEVTLSGDSFIDANRASANAGVLNNAINFSKLTVPSGARALTVDSGNGYMVGFNELAGAGTLIKGGASALQLNGYSGFTGNIAVAGPVGLALPAAQNLNLNAANNALPGDFTVGGLHTFTSSKTVSIAGALEVSRNPGAVVNGTNGVSTGGIVGSVVVPAGANVTASILRNNGQIGSTAGTGLITAPSIRGQGVYQTAGQALTLAGNLQDDTAAATTLKVAGDAAVTLTATASTSTGGVEVQSGILRIAPSGPANDPLGTGPVRVLGSAATAPGPNSQAVAAVNPTLQFDGGANAIVQSGNITNAGTLLASSGTTTVAGTISGTPTVYVPGLREGLLTGTTSLDSSATRVANPGNFGIRLEPRMGQTNLVTQNPLTGWGDNQTWIYTGEFYDLDGLFSFAENIDDSVFVSIDGVTRLTNGTFNTVTSTAFSVGQNGTTLNVAGANPQAGIATNFGNPDLDNDPFTGNGGWHTFEVRFQNAGGGAGPVTGNGFFANYGFGLNQQGATALDGSLYTRPIDPGNGSLFRTATGGEGTITVNSGATLLAGGVSMTSALNLQSAATTSRFELTGTGPGNNVNTLNLTGTAGTGTVAVTDATGNLAVNNAINLPAATSLRKDGAGTLTLQNLTATTGVDSAILLNQGTVAFAAGSLGTAKIDFTGTSTLRFLPGNTEDVSARIQPFTSGVTARFDTNGNSVSFANALSGAGDLAKSGLGTLTLGGENTFTGSTNVNGGILNVAGALTNAAGTSGSTAIVVNTGGTLLLSGSAMTNKIKDTAAFTLNGGTFNTGGIDGLNEQIGALTLTATSTIDLAMAPMLQQVRFADSSTQAWNGLATLSIYNWTGTFRMGGGTDQIFVGTDGTGLAQSQLDKISFFSDAGNTFLGTAGFTSGMDGEIVPVPEPSVFLAAMSLLGLAGWRERQREQAKRRATRKAGR